MCVASAVGDDLISKHINSIHRKPLVSVSCTCRPKLKTG